MAAVDSLVLSLLQLQRPWGKLEALRGGLQITGSVEQLANWTGQLLEACEAIRGQQSNFKRLFAVVLRLGSFFPFVSVSTGNVRWTSVPLMFLFLFFSFPSRVLWMMDGVFRELPEFRDSERDGLRIPIGFPGLAAEHSECVWEIHSPAVHREVHREEFP